MNNEKMIFILLGIIFIVSAVAFSFAWSGFDVAASGASLEAMRDNHISDRSSQLSPAIITTALSGVSSSIQIMPLVVSVVLLGAISIGLFTLIKKEKSKPRVSFVRGRDAKKLAPDIWKKKKQYEREQIRGLQRETNSLDSELTDLARIAKVNALSGMGGNNRFGAPYSPGVSNEHNPFLSEDEQ